MKTYRFFIVLLACLILLAGCGKRPEAALEQAREAYEAFLTGDLSLFADTDVQTWGLEAWADTVLPCGELEYTLLDLDGDGTQELLVQRVDDPASYNGVFHYEDGRLYCWQNDISEGACRDYPLGDGTMVRQYELSGSCTYTLFRYCANGSTEEAANLFAREEVLDPASSDPCPYYEIDGQAVEKAQFEARLEQIRDNILHRQAWIPME